MAPQLSCYIQETDTSELYTLNGYDINHCSDSYDESFLFAFVLPRTISNNFVDLIMEGQIFQNISPESYIYRTYYSEKQLNEIYRSSSRFIIGIIFNDSLFNYTIKLDKAFIPPDMRDPIPYYRKLENIYKVGRSSFFKQFDSLLDPNRSLYEIFFCPIQKAVDEAILKLVLNNKYFDYEVNLGQFAEPLRYCDNSSALNHHIFLPCIVGLFMILSKDIVSFIVDEKEAKTKKAFVLSGVKSSVFSLSWLIQYSFNFVISIALITFTLQLLGLIVNIEPEVYFLIFVIYGMSTIGMAYLYSVICKKLKYAEPVYLYLSIATMLTTTYILNLDRSWRVILSTIFSPVGVVSLMKEISITAGVNNHVTVKELFQNDALLFYCSLVFTTIFYFLVSILLDKILVTREICEEYLIDFYEIIRFNDEINPKNNKQITSLNQKINEPVIEVVNINKNLSYIKKDDVSILRSISFGIPLEGIYGIVGKPGSGAKTLMHIMLGNVKPDSGDILYNGKKLTNSDSNKIKKDIGNICIHFIINNFIKKKLNNLH